MILEEFLGDYGNSRRPFPIFSLSRHDVLLTMFLSLLCLYIAVAVRIGQPLQVSGNSPWKGVCVVFGAIWGSIFAIIACCKIFCGYGEFQQPEYTLLDSEETSKKPIEARDLEKQNFQNEVKPKNVKPDGFPRANEVIQQCRRLVLILILNKFIAGRCRVPWFEKSKTRSF